MIGRARSGLWGAADAYERYMGRWSRAVAPLFLDWLAPAPGGRWADIGCGTGELSARIAARCAPDSLLGIDSSAGFLQAAAARVPSARFREGNAQQLDLPDGGLDHAVSGLVLNFVPDPPRLLREMARVVRPGGDVALYVWDYAGQMQIMRRFFDVAREIDPGAVAHDDGVQAPICRPEALRAAFAQAGLAAEVAALDIPAAFASFEEYWSPFLGGTGSAPRYCVSLPEATRERIREALRTRLPAGPDGEILLAVRAWGAKAKVPG